METKKEAKENMQKSAANEMFDFHQKPEPTDCRNLSGKSRATLRKREQGKI